jgi:hypothetical protein
MGFHTFTCAQPQARPTQQIFFLTALHRRIIWSSSQLSVRRRPAQRSSSVSDRNHTPNSGALSQVCVLEDVSRSCNHQHSLQQLPKNLTEAQYHCFLLSIFSATAFVSSLKLTSSLTGIFLVSIGPYNL